MYWVGPVIGGLLAAAMYEYLLWPDSKLKQRYSQVFSRGRFPSEPLVVADPDQGRFTEKQPAFTVLDVERAERLERDREPAREVLSSV